MRGLRAVTAAAGSKKLGACSVDKFRLKQSKSKAQEKSNGQEDGNEEDDTDDSLPEAVQSHIDEAVPSALKIYALYKRTIYCADLKASDVAKKLENGACHHIFKFFSIAAHGRITKWHLWP